jgi:hypothetical protein
MATSCRTIFLILLVFLLWIEPVRAQVQGRPTDQCNYRDGRGWVRCGDYPGGKPGPPPIDFDLQRSDGELEAARASAYVRSTRG